MLVLPALAIMCVAWQDEIKLQLLTKSPVDTAEAKEAHTNAIQLAIASDAYAVLSV